MEWLRIFGARLRGLFRKRQLDGELDAELHAHLELLTEENIRRGMSPADARYAARREFGGVEQMKELHRHQRSIPFFGALLQDLRFASRMLAKKPGFTFVAVLTLALGIGATTAVFSVVDRALFRSLPYPNEDRLVSFGLLAPIERDEFMLGSGYVDFRKEPGPFETVTSMAPGTSDCDITEQNAIRLNCALVEQTFLPTLGVQPMLGHNFTPDEDRPNAPHVVLLSYSLWKSRFAGDPGILGKTISLDGNTTRIVGVLPSIFEMPTLAAADILIPLALDEDQQRRSEPGRVLRTFARLRPGINVPMAVAGLQPFFERAVLDAPPEFRKEIHLSIQALRDRQVRDARLASWLLLGSVFAVFLIACTNVANLLLARVTGRQRELAVRAALGASRGRLVRQALTESLLLSLLGGVLGCAMAQVLLRLFMSIAPQGIVRLHEARLDLRVIVFTLAVALISAVFSGLVPALYRPAPELLIGKDVRATTRNVLRQALVSAQIAISLMLLAGAGLLLRSLLNLQNVRTGMRTENVLTEAISLGGYRYPTPEQQIAFFSELQGRLKRLPGVTSLALSDSLPPSGQMRSTIFAAIEVPGRPLLKEGTGGMVGWRAVTPDYFSALSIPIIRGRGFRQEDRLPTENTIILNETLARELYADAEPIGQQLRLFRMQGPWRTVVGVAADVKNSGLTVNADPEFYLPWKNDPVESLSTAHIIVRTGTDPKAMAAWMRAEIVALDQTLPFTIETMSQRVGKLAQRPRFTAVLLSLFAGIGVLLAGIGIYGVVGFLVAQQTREIGIRISLGATSRNVLTMVLLNMVRWTVAGAAFGLLGSWLSSRFLESLLFEVRAHDPFLLASALFVLLAVAFFAAWIPARRAMRVDPMIALRYE